jgi:hypothetical protein
MIEEEGPPERSYVGAGIHVILDPKTHKYFLKMFLHPKATEVWEECVFYCKGPAWLWEGDIILYDTFAVAEATAGFYATNRRQHPKEFLRCFKTR